MRTIERRLHALEQANEPSGIAVAYMRDGETEGAAIERYTADHRLPSFHRVIIIAIPASDAML